MTTLTRDTAMKTIEKPRNRMLTIVEFRQNIRDVVEELFPHHTPEQRKAYYSAMCQELGISSKDLIKRAEA